MCTKHIATNISRIEAQIFDLKNHNLFSQVNNFLLLGGAIKISYQQYICVKLHIAKLSCKNVQFLFFEQRNVNKEPHKYLLF